MWTPPLIVIIYFLKRHECHASHNKCVQSHTKYVCYFTFVKDHSQMFNEVTFAQQCPFYTPICTISMCSYMQMNIPQSWVTQFLCQTDSKERTPVSACLTMTHKNALSLLTSSAWPWICSARNHPEPQSVYQPCPWSVPPVSVCLLSAHSHVQSAPHARSPPAEGQTRGPLHAAPV